MTEFPTPMRSRVSSCERAVDRDEIGFEEQFVERDEADAEPRASAGVIKRVVHERGLHAEARQQLDKRTPDSAEADDAERAVAEFGAHVTLRSSHRASRTSRSLVRT